MSIQEICLDAYKPNAMFFNLIFKPFTNILEYRHEAVTEL